MSNLNNEDEIVTWAYRLLLDRDPENEEVVEEKTQNFESIKSLREEILSCDEFRTKNVARMAKLTGLEPKLDVGSQINEQHLDSLLQRIEGVWNHLGNEKPHWSVISEEQYLDESFVEEDFFLSGEDAFKQIRATLERNDVEISSSAKCLEYGCGLGRVTFWLSRFFKEVYAFDISTSHLRQASSRMHSQGMTNIQFARIGKLADLSRLPKVDFFYSIIVLQHNPPPIIEHILRKLMGTLTSGGIGMFQVPTYLQNYRFDIEDYLNTEPSGIEMHATPQSRVFSIIAESNCEVVEVLDDDYIGSQFTDCSNTFLIRKKKARSIFH